MIRIMVLVGVLFMAGCQEKYIVIGASNTSGRDSWAAQINERRQDFPDLPYLKVMAQPGLTLTQFSFPAWLRQSGVRQNNDTGVLMMLGFNDAWKHYDVEQFRERLAIEVQVIESAGFPLTCIQIPTPPAIEHLYLDPLRFEPYQEIMQELCPQIIYVDWEWDETKDGVHMTRLGHTRFAERVLWALGELEQQDDNI